MWLQRNIFEELEFVGCIKATQGSIVDEMKSQHTSASFCFFSCILNAYILT